MIVFYFCKKTNVDGSQPSVGNSIAFSSVVILYINCFGLKPISTAWLFVALKSRDSIKNCLIQFTVIFQEKKNITVSATLTVREAVDSIYSGFSTEIEVVEGCGRNSGSKQTWRTANFLLLFASTPLINKPGVTDTSNDFYPTPLSRLVERFYEQMELTCVTWRWICWQTGLVMIQHKPRGEILRNRWWVGGFYFLKSQWHPVFGVSVFMCCVTSNNPICVSGC